MRRSERELNRAQTLEILKGQDVCQLALTDGVKPYIVTLNYGAQESDHGLILYLHCAGEGRKLDLIKANPAACFTVVGAHRPIGGVNACSYTMEYESVVGEGNIGVVSSPEEKTAGLTAIMSHYLAPESISFSPRSLAAVTVLRLTVESLSGKRLAMPIE